MNTAKKIDSAIQDVQGVVAVTENVPTAGAIVWWRLSGTVDYEKLKAAWAAAGLDEKRLPLPCTPTTALRRAANELREKRRLVRPLGRGNGFAIVRERVTKDQKELDYEVLCKVTLNAVGRVQIETVGAVDNEVAKISHEVRAAYEKHLGELQTEDFSGWLVRLMPHLDAVGLRDSGGVYFVPHAAVDSLARAAAVLRDVSEHAVHRVPALRSDDAVDAILDAVAQEAEAEALAMEQDIVDGKLGAKGYTNRVVTCEEVEAKVTRYEELLGRSLPKLTERLEKLRANLTVAAMKADQAAGGGGTSLADL